MMFKKLGILTILVVLALMVSVPAVSARGQALATGSIHIQPGLYDPVEDDFSPTDVHINFNARVTEGGATGHLFWREDGQVNRVSVATLVFQFWGMPDCAWITGEVYDGPRTGQHLCLVICEGTDDAPARLYGNFWRVAPFGEALDYYSGAPALSGNVVIKE
jgi:hypothetical protein